MSGLRVRRGGRLVLPGVSLSVPAGAVTGVLGPSGCGKTTLLRAIVGVQVVESGTVRALGLSAGCSELRRRLGYMTQAPSVYADLTVRENLRYFAETLGANDAGRTAAVVGLEPRLDALVRDLSGGEQARTSLAVALLGDPDILVLDEPTVGLDPVLRRDLWATFHQLAGRGTTVLVSTHVMDEAERCDHLLLMRDGRVVAAGTPAGLRDRTHTSTLEDAFIALAEEN